MFAAVEERAASGQPQALRNLALARTALRIGPAGERAVSPAAPRGAAGAALPDAPRQGRQGAAGADFDARADGGGGRRGSAVAPPGSLWLFPSGKAHLSPGAAVPDRAGDGGRCRDRARTGQPARPAPCLCDPFAGGRGRPARAAVAARPCRHRDDANLHPCRQRAAGRAGQRAPSAGGNACDR